MSLNQIPDFMLSDEAGSVKDKIAVLSGVGGVVEKVNKSEFDLYKAETANYINVTSCGATGDGVSDDIDSIVVAITKVTLLKSLGKTPTLIFPGMKKYNVSDTVVIPHGINVIMDSPLNYIGNEFDRPVLQIGTPSVRNEKVTLKLWVEKEDNYTWDSEDYVGMKLINPYASMISITGVNGAYIGVQFLGDGEGCSHNITKLGKFLNNKIGIDLTNKNNGWCNENIYISGSWYVGGSYALNKARYGVRIGSLDGTYVNNNNNNFIKPSFELNKENAGEAEAISVLIQNGNYNNFEQCRVENCEDVVARFENDSQFNEIGVGVYYHHDLLPARIEHPNGKSNLITIRSGKPDTIHTYNIFSIDNLGYKVNNYNGADICVNGLDCNTATNGVPRRNIYGGTNIIWSNEYLILNTTSEAVGVYVDTSIVKDFILRRNVKSTNVGRFLVQCFDANNAQITDTTILNKVISGFLHGDTNIFYVSTNFGSCLFAGSDTYRTLDIRVPDEVKSIHIAITSSPSLACHIKGFSIDAIAYGYPVGYEVASWGNGKAVKTWLSYVLTNPQNGVAIGPPTLGTYIQGKIIDNVNIMELGTTGSKYVLLGWVCVAGGTPGTWVERRNITGN